MISHGVSPANKYTVQLVALAFLCASLSQVFLPTRSCAETPAAQTEQLAAQAVKQRGKQLRAELDRAYRQLRASNSLARIRKGSNDVTAIVVKYIPPGISFDDAEAILRAAGCKIEQNTPPMAEGYIFVSTPLGGGLLDPLGHALAIKLIPRTPGDFSVVGEVTAAIFATWS
jgi:hypothetical protein